MVGEEQQRKGVSNSTLMIKVIIIQFLLLQQKENTKVTFLGINLALPTAKNSNQILTEQATPHIHYLETDLLNG